MAKEFVYKGLKVTQTDNSPDLILFSAPAVEIEKWSGIPQKKKEEDHETTGFQRVEDPKRLEEIEKFCYNQENTIQNPLLCAIRGSESFTPEFLPTDDEGNFGEIKIKVPEFSEMTLLQLMENLKQSLEDRIETLKGKTVSTDKINEIREKIPADMQDNTANGDEIDEIEEIDENSTDVLLEDETHIVDFWEELACRIEVLKELGSSFESDSFLGFSKKAMISFLMPIFVVDGQHRLQGAIISAHSRLETDPFKTEIETALTQESANVDEIREEFALKVSRNLPISLLLNPDPAEHVFQFVVVNQKATPMGRSLLGTIISTTLSKDELDRISQRLEDAGIPLEESKAITQIARNSNSPFFEKIERGIVGDKKNLLSWSVIGGLINIFKRLKGGRLFHSKVDFSDRWKEYCLDRSGIISGWEAAHFEDSFSYWNSLNGPWNDVFIKFWTCIRDEFGTEEDQDAFNYWGNPRKSNLFNKVSLTILAADFFQFLGETKKTIDSIDDIPNLVKEWLGEVNRTYFSRDWSLSGVKKDSSGIRSQWSKTWDEYRKFPKELPRVATYRKPLN